MAERITGHTELLTLMAYPIRHSSSPAMHNEALAYLGLDYAYLCFEVDQHNLKQSIESMRTLKIRGGNISMPNKEAVIPYLDKLTPEAELCGAVNTIVNDDGILTGHITDGAGYVRALQDCGFDVQGKSFTVVGAGGAGKAIAVQLALSGAGEISIFNPKDQHWQRAQETTAMLRERLQCPAKLYDLADLTSLKTCIHESDLLANATSVGMTPQKPWTYIPDLTFFRAGMHVTDVVYAPPKTRFLELAEMAGCPTMNGFPMMLFQGAEAFRLWTGQDMPIEYMKKYLGIL